MIVRRAACLLVFLCSAAAGPAGAATLSASDILSQFNAVILGSLTTTADVEGRTVVGGDMTGGATFYLKPGSSAASSFSALTVYGNEAGGATFNINNGGGAAIGGFNRGSFNLNTGGGISVGGANAGALNAANGNGSIVVGGSNSGTLTAGAGGSVFVGGSNGAGITVNGTGSATVLSANAGTISMGNGGNVYAGSNSGNIAVNGSAGSVALNGGNTGQLTLNGGGSVKIAGDTGNINLNGGTVVYGGSRTGNQNLNGGATITASANPGIAVPTAPSTALPGFGTNFQAPLVALSTQLAALTPNSTVSASGNSVTFNASPDASGRAVFDIATSVFAPNSTVSIALDGATTVIINVNVDSCAGSVCAFTLPSSVNFANPTSYADRVMWNFVNATGITFSNEFGGSVLALGAAVTNNGPIDGTLVAASYKGNGELHNYNFTGALPGPAPAPEPASLAVLVAGLAGLCAVRRRKR